MTSQPSPSAPESVDQRIEQIEKRYAKQAENFSTLIDSSDDIPWLLSQLKEHREALREAQSVFAQIKNLKWPDREADVFAGMHVFVERFSEAQTLSIGAIASLAKLLPLPPA